MTPFPLTERELALARRLATDLRHRGPDGAGEHVAANVALMHRRLSIIDVAGGAQPLFNETRDVAVVANGEIYNHVELRADLERRGHRFATRSDCEVIVHLYEAHGSDFVRRLRGMFAFALHDMRRGIVLLARDRLGEKPLFLARRDGRLWFSSELTPLVRALGVNDLDPQALSDYFCFQYVPGEQTPFAGVRRVPPAHMITLQVTLQATQQTGELGSRAERYWHPLDDPSAHESDAMPARATLSERLDDISRVIVRADVRVGVALSGGVDSSLVAALAARATNASVTAFTVGYTDDGGSDERRDAAELARFLGIAHREVELSTERIVSGFPVLVAARDEPIADIAGSAYSAVAAAAREHDTPVLLFGHGGDELFWGYRWLHREARRAMVRTRGAALFDPLQRSPAGNMIDRALRGGRGLAGDVDDVRARLARVVVARASERYAYAANQDWWFSRAVRTRLLAQRAALAAVEPPEHVFAKRRTRPDLDATFDILDTFLRENGLAQTDRLAMAHGVEPRVPLVDHLLVEDVLRGRAAATDVFLPGKARLRTAARELLPSFVMRRRKRGFTPPVAEWHRALFARYGALLDGGALVEHGALDPAAAVALRYGPRHAHEGSTPLAFKALVLELWLRQLRGMSLTATHATGGPAPAPPPRATRETSRANEPAPIAVLGFARPAHLERTLASLARAAGAERARLSIYLDGTRSNEQRTAVDDTRAVARAFAGRRDFRSIRLVERERNWGLARSVRTAVDELVSESGRAIIVEDDLRVSPAFLSFMNNALERYRDEERVMQVAGYMFPVEIAGPHRALFLPFIGTWGWATWERAWRKLDPTMRDAHVLRDDVQRRAFDLDGAYPYTAMLERQRAFVQDSWAIAWYLAVFRSRGLALYPSRSLVEMADREASGEHVATANGFAGPAHPESPPRWPKEIAVDEDAYRAIRQHLARTQGSTADRIAAALGTGPARAGSSLRQFGRRAAQRFDETVDPVGRAAALLHSMKR